ncbi:MAG: amino acid permease [Cytophagales bacterium]|nr:MAG: amino acid permease [Cytophagales bacterium]
MNKLFRKNTFEVENNNNEILSKTLTVKDLVFFGIAAIVGASIFSTIGSAVSSGGPAVVYLFIFTAITCGFSALCYAQLASAIPISGSSYTYTYIIFGELAAWIIGWDLFMEYAVSNVAVAIAWSGYFLHFLRGFGVDLLIDFQFFNSNFHIDYPAAGITILVTYICYIGIQESKKFNNILVVIKLLVILIIICIGVFYINPANWHPFAPNGVSGVLVSISSVFFAYIGFDAISTTAEECKNPQKDIPKAMIWSLVISTIIYTLLTLTITGMVNYTKLNVPDPLAFVFDYVGLHFFAGCVSFISIITLSSVILVYQLGQPRIWFAMSRDGLLPKKFSMIHPIYKTPSFATIITGFAVAIPALFFNINDIIDLTSIGTLFAFALVCSGVIYLEITKKELPSKFKITYISSKIGLPIIAVIFFLIYNFSDFNFDLNTKNIIFCILTLFISIYSIYKNLSLLPVLGLIFNIALLCQMGTTNWIRFLIWLALGLFVYFFYSQKNSKLNV